MTTFTHATSRGQSESDTLSDAKAMLAAAENDPAVAKKLGPAYLKRMQADLDHADLLVTGKGSVQHDKLAEGAHVKELAEELLVVLQDIRDSADEQSDATARALGRGANWKATQPAELAKAAHGVATFLHEHKSVAKDIGLDTQHAHDLTHLADAIDEAHDHHVALKADVKSDTVARKKLIAVLRSRAHHVRLKARIAHRHDEAGLARFASPVAHHQVVHHAKKPEPTPSA